jgi:hypothetical protein
MGERIQTAESEIRDRHAVLSQDHNGTAEEREALVNATKSLKLLEKDRASWLERQRDRGAESERQRALDATLRTGVRRTGTTSPSVLLRTVT